MDNDEAKKKTEEMLDLLKKFGEATGEMVQGIGEFFQEVSKRTDQGKWAEIMPPNLTLELLVFHTILDKMDETPVEYITPQEWMMGLQKLTHLTRDQYRVCRGIIKGMNPENPETESLWKTLDNWGDGVWRSRYDKLVQAEAAAIVVHNSLVEFAKANQGNKGGADEAHNPSL